MKKIIITILFASFIGTLCYGAAIKDIKTYEYERSAKIVLFMDSIPKHTTMKGNNYFRLKLYGAKYGIPEKEVATVFFRKFKIKKEYNSTDIVVQYKYLTAARVTTLTGPNRIVVSFNRISNSPLKTAKRPEITGITKKSLPNMFKLSIAMDGAADYKIRKSGLNLIVELINANSVIKSRQIVTGDSLVKKVGVDQAGRNILVSFMLTYPAYYKVYKTEAPYRVIIEIDKKSKSTVSKKEIVPGLTYMRVVKGSKKGATYANVLLADPAKVDIFPYMPGKKGEESRNFFDSLLSVFSKPEEEKVTYRRDTVSNLVRKAGATGGINGTFFGKNGEPLGILMISRELISYSIHDRTALIIDKNNKCFIDNVSLSGGVMVDGISLEITGINERRETGDVIIYTPRYGKQTDDKTPGLNLSVEDGEVKYISRGKTWIPKKGYVISADPTYHEKLKHFVKVGSKVRISMVLSTFSSFDMADLKHIVGGGPRLIKGGQLYVSKNIEKFRWDVATSRAARTAVGITGDGKLLLVTVDKNKTRYYPELVNPSAGMTLEELAGLMDELGAVEAMNLDGGSSTTFVLGRNIKNNPASGEERRVSNAILVKERF
ncbi:phosphodiester glycosidase family protein [Candidatus Margulisiibacteriota bacterium]